MHRSPECGRRGAEPDGGKVSDLQAAPSKARVLSIGSALDAGGSGVGRAEVGVGAADVDALALAQQLVRHELVEDPIVGGRFQVDWAARLLVGVQHGAVGVADGLLLLLLRLLPRAPLRGDLCTETLRAQSSPQPRSG